MLKGRNKNKKKKVSQLETRSVGGTNFEKLYKK